MDDIVLRMKALPDLTNEKAWEIIYEGAREIERLRKMEVTDAMVEAGVLAYDAFIQAADGNIYNLDEWQANVSCAAMRAALEAALANGR